MKKNHVLPIFLFFSLSTFAQNNLQTENLILVTLDGLRWEEVFGGAVDSMMNDTKYVKDTTALQELFADKTPEKRRKKLLPFFWNTIAEKGQLYGNRWLDNKVNLSNFYWFSYPGYNEMLVGYSDPDINSNDKKWNENETVLEWLNKQKAFKGKVAAFASWDVFPYIINEKRSNIPVNAGFETAKGKNLTEMEKALNILQPQVPSPWSSVRLDAFTHHYALEYIKKEQPRVVYIAYGETDDFAHDGRYDHYLKSAKQTSDWLEEIWEYAQSDPFYKDKTTMLITTDHGRGSSPKEEWKSHGKTYEGSNAIWMAVIGPDTPALGEVKEKGQLWQGQVAKTAAAFLGLDYENVEQVGKVMEGMIRE